MVRLRWLEKITQPQAALAGGEAPGSGPTDSGGGSEACTPRRSEATRVLQYRTDPDECGLFRWVDVPVVQEESAK